MLLEDILLKKFNKEVLTKLLYLVLEKLELANKILPRRAQVENNTYSRLQAFKQILLTKLVRKNYLVQKLPKALDLLKKNFVVWKKKFNYERNLKMLFKHQILNLTHLFKQFKKLVMLLIEQRTLNKNIKLVLKAE